ncbi:vWA domain-containing protein [Mesonia mobilis]|uniref:vWA domain-containing protein n=1 Tax=Mesonia mobilis TaxID=369791 RepID=UPI0026F0C2A5|nr:VWA domain-containing protein [Mesonia mobilis]
MKNFKILLVAIALCFFSCNRDIKNSIQQKNQQSQTNQVPQILEEDVETLDYNDVEALEAPSLLERKTEAISTSNNIHTIPAPQENRESYQEIEENTFKMVNASPLSTFSIDVDKASYSNVRRMINNGQEVPKDAVKIEEFINYFDYDYPQPTGVDPFSINTEVAQSPWNKDTKLVKIGLQGKEVPLDDIPPSNLVFLIDVSGSMNSTNKLPLLKSAFKLMVNQLRDEDKISIVTYAGAAGLALEPTSDKNKILEALNNLNAGGSTAGGQGIKLAYKIAEENFIKKGNNRVILATDGDFNVGASSDQAMEDLIVEKRESGVFLTCLGFGTGNYQDSKMETLADKGNGNHAYIDTMQEAQRVLGTEFGSTLYTIAKDVKIQVEFNPAKVQAYRLIGYENRLLNAEDFNDDKKDAGELGSGHTVTALYEIIPVGVKSEWLKDIDDLKYSDKKVKGNAEDLLTVKFRYKKPDGDKSKLITKVVKDEDIQLKNASTDLKFSAALAMFGMQLRESEYAKNISKENIIELAKAGKGKDEQGYRAEFIRLVNSSI